MERQIEEFVQELTPEAKQKIAHALENYETPEGFYIAQCGHCGGLITITARGEEADKR